MKDVLVSVDYVMDVYDKLFALLKKELKQHNIIDPQLNPSSFNIHFKKLIDSETHVKISLVNGSLDSKISFFERGGHARLHYSFEVLVNENIVANGLFKVEILKSEASKQNENSKIQEN